MTITKEVLRSFTTIGNRLDLYQLKSKCRIWPLSNNSITTTKNPNSINESEISFKEYLCRFILIQVRIMKIECDFSHSHNLLDMFKFQAIRDFWNKISYLLKFEHILVCWKTYLSDIFSWVLFWSPKGKNT